MPMIPFIERFPDLGGRETRSVTATQRPDLPDGEYGFVELYCDEPGCDCRRVTIDVLRPETGWSKIWATISYGWESLDFYRTWGGVGCDPIAVKGPYLDPLNPQTQYSSALLKLFQFLVQSLVQSPDYVQRFQQHYQMFREAAHNEAGRSNSQGRNLIEHKRKHLRKGMRRRPH